MNKNWTIRLLLSLSFLSSMQESVCGKVKRGHNAQKACTMLRNDQPGIMARSLAVLNNKLVQVMGALTYATCTNGLCFQAVSVFDTVGSLGISPDTTKILINTLVVTACNQAYNYIEKSNLPVDDTHIMAAHRDITERSQGSLWSSTTSIETFKIVQ